MHHRTFGSHFVRIIFALLLVTWGLFAIVETVQALADTDFAESTADGMYGDQAAHRFGRFRLTRQGERVTTFIASDSSPVQHYARQNPQILFTIPPEFRPPFTIIRLVEGRPVLQNGNTDPDNPTLRRFLIQVDPDGAVRYVNDLRVNGIGYLSYTLNTSWGTTPLANDQAVLDILGTATGLELENGAYGVTKDESGRVVAINWQESGPAYAPEHFIPPNIRNSWELPPELGQLTQLSTLIVGGPQLHGEIPPELSQLKNLNVLVLKNSRMSGEIPSSLGELTNLKQLDLSGNYFTALPSQIGELEQLTMLDLGGNRLTTLPNSFGQLHSLRSLDLGSNQIVQLPGEFSGLERL